MCSGELERVWVERVILAKDTLITEPLDLSVSNCKTNGVEKQKEEMRNHFSPSI